MSIIDPIKISFIGDIFPGELPYTVGYGIRTQFSKHLGSLWKGSILELLGSNDIICGNLESPLVSEKNALKMTFLGDPEFALFLRECGINVLNVANNHILEQGEKGFRSTVQVLKENEIGIIGCHDNTNSTVHYKETKGKKIGIAGFSNVDLHMIKNDGLFTVLNEEKVLESLYRMKSENADFKILCFHWGNEYINIPSLEQRKLARKFIDEGADVIVGHHPHVIQPWEKYKHGHIFYSLGNFMFDYIHSEIVSKGLVVTLTFSTDVKSIVVNLAGVKLSNGTPPERLENEAFFKYYSRVVDLYERMCKLSDAGYEQKYKRMLSRNHLFQRILMKSALLKEFYRVKRSEKKLLLRNLAIYYFNRNIQAPDI